MWTLGYAYVGRKGINVVARKAEGCDSAADKAADPLYYPLNNFPLPLVMQKPYWCHSIEGPSHVE